MCALAIAGLFYLKGYFQKDLKAQLQTENTTATSNALDTQKAALAAGEAKLEQANDAAAKAQAAEDEKLKNFTPEEVTAYYNGQGNSGQGNQ
jgi:Tfp pilus assembly protein PilX